MRSALVCLSQMAVMAAIIATLLYLPVGVVLALALRLAGVRLESFVTFGGSLGTLSGLFVWWLLAFAGACVYAAWAFPWRDKVFAWPRKS
jgi:hypothetical protein